jgi:hypothetical protein
MAHLIASTILLLPHPFGPTIALMPNGKEISSLSMKDLKPIMDSLLIFILTSHAQLLMIK